MVKALSKDDNVSLLCFKTMWTEMDILFTERRKELIDYTNSQMHVKHNNLKSCDSLIGKCARGKIVQTQDYKCKRRFSTLQVIDEDCESKEISEKRRLLRRPSCLMSNCRIFRTKSIHLLPSIAECDENHHFLQC